MTAAARQRFDDLPPAQQAGMLSNDPQFRAFAAHRLCGADAMTPTAAAEFIRLQCGVNSRAALNTNREAAQRFAALRTEFDAWRGKIATQR
jgi:hypothetical protein